MEVTTIMSALGNTGDTSNNGRVTATMLGIADDAVADATIDAMI